MPRPQARVSADVGLAITPEYADYHLLYDMNSFQLSSASNISRFRANVVAKMQSVYRTLDMCRGFRIQSIQFPPSTDRTVITQLLV